MSYSALRILYSGAAEAKQEKSTVATTKQSCLQSTELYM